MRRWIIGATAAALIAAPVAADPRPPQAFYDRVDELVQWIGENSDYPGELARYPAVVFLPRETINYLFYEGSAGIAYDGQDRVKALYLDGMMFLGDDFTLGKHDYILLHELVHHLQFEHKREFRCKAEQEREAYALQIRFVEATGRGEVPNALFMMVLRCDVH
jgi:hypothetical protein